MKVCARRQIVTTSATVAAQLAKPTTAAPAQQAESPGAPENGGPADGGPQFANLLLHFERLRRCERVGVGHSILQFRRAREKLPPHDPRVIVCEFGRLRRREFGEGFVVEREIVP
jgi:hypothetical protein